MLSSFIIRYHTRRLDNLLQTLRFLERWHSPVIKQSEVHLLCHDRCGPIKTGFRKTYNYNMELSEMGMAKQLNFGVEKSNADIIVLLDSDRVLSEGYYERVLDKIQEKQMYSCLRMVRVTRMVADEDIISCQYPSYKEWRSMTNESLSRNIFSGNVTFLKSDFYECGCADEGYVGYGWEDHDMTKRMEKIGVKPVFVEEDLELHLWHEFFTYGTQDQKKLFVKNGVRYCRKWKVPYPPELMQEMQNYSKFII